MGRTKLDRSRVDVRVAATTRQTLIAVSSKLGYLYDGEGSIGQLLDAIATGKIILTVVDKSQ